MWPTGLPGSSVQIRWSERSVRNRALAALGIAGLLIVASIATVVSIRGGQPATAPLYGGGLAPGAVWTWDGTSYHLAPANGPGPSSNDSDMAYDRTRGVVVLWDHGCARLVMGFQGGCVERVNRTWTWDGKRWNALPTTSSPTSVGPGAMLFDAGLGQVLYVNRLAQVWAWSGVAWARVAAPGFAGAVQRGAGAASSTFAAGYDDVRGLLIIMVSDGTWSWNGTGWNRIGGALDGAEARADAHIVFDPTHGQLVYVGARFTWTWDGGRWQAHSQPAIASGTLAYDPSRGGVMLLQQDSSACDRVACRTTTWTWDSSTWTELPLRDGPLLPLTRTGALGPPIVADEARREAVVFVSAV